MKKLLLLLAGFMGLALAAPAAPPKPRPRPAVTDSAAYYQAGIDSVNQSFHYQQGHIMLPGGVGELTVPPGFRYLDSTQASYVMHKLWHNPPQESLGMLFPDDKGPVSDASGLPHPV